MQTMQTMWIVGSGDASDTYDACAGTPEPSNDITFIALQMVLLLVLQVHGGAGIRTVVQKLLIMVMVHSL